MICTVKDIFVSNQKNPRKNQQVFVKKNVFLAISLKAFVSVKNICNKIRFDVVSEFQNCQ